MQDERALAIFEAHGPTLTAREARSHGLHWEDLYRLRDAGRLEELSRGVFRLSSAPSIELIDIVAVLARAPRAIACLDTAAAIWDLTDEIPRAVHIAVPRGAHRPRIEWPTTTVHVFKATTFDIGRQKHELLTGETFAVYSPERTVVDTIRLAHRQASEPLGELIRRYLARTGATPARLLGTARELGTDTAVRRILEIVMP
jgi:predicted transcriptional regulator of viral defense system